MFSKIWTSLFVLTNVQKWILSFFRDPQNFLKIRGGTRKIFKRTRKIFRNLWGRVCHVCTNHSGWAWIKNVLFDYYGERTPPLNELHLVTISTRERIPPGIGLHSSYPRWKFCVQPWKVAIAVSLTGRCWYKVNKSLRDVSSSPHCI